MLVNPLDGAVRSLPAPRREGEAPVLAGLPMFDFPLLIVERAELGLASARATPEHAGIPRL